jgi:hypothetical protein
MRRREFVDHLIRITELNTQLEGFKEIPLFCCKQTKINERSNRKTIVQQDSIERSGSIKKELVVMCGKKQGLRPYSSNKCTEAETKQADERLKSVPSSSSSIFCKEIQLTSSPETSKALIPQSGSFKTEPSRSKDQGLIHSLSKKLGFKPYSTLKRNLTTSN